MDPPGLGPGILGPGAQARPGETEATGRRPLPPAPAPGAKKRARSPGRKGKPHSRDAVPNGTVATDVHVRDDSGATFYVPARPLAPSTGTTQRHLNERSAHALVLHIVQHSDVRRAHGRRRRARIPGVPPVGGQGYPFTRFPGLHHFY